MKKQQSGFTLIELVMVIVILGILAAVALPKFVDLSTNANLATAKGLAGSIASAAAIQYAADKANSTTNYSVAAACATNSTFLVGQNFGNCTVGLATSTCTVTCDGQSASVLLP